MEVKVFPHLGESPRMTFKTVRCPRHKPSRDYIALELWELRYPSLVQRRLSDVVEHSCIEQRR
jgi:hypothetical protein